MIDFFYEETASYSSKNGSKLKGKVFSALSGIFYFLSAAWAMFAFFSVIDPNNFLISFVFVMAIFLVFFFTGFFFRKAKERVFVDYDYTILTGNVEFSKIVGNDKRKSIIKVKLKSD